MDLDLKYGKGTIRVHIPESVQTLILEPNHIDPVASVREELSKALVDLERSEAELIAKLTKSATVAIAIPDETRPLPVQKVLPILFDYLFQVIPAEARRYG